VEVMGLGKLGDEVNWGRRLALGEFLPHAWRAEDQISTNVITVFYMSLNRRGAR
jgi:hypothetical protein